MLTHTTSCVFVCVCLITNMRSRKEAFTLRILGTFLYVTCNRTSMQECSELPSQLIHYMKKLKKQNMSLRDLMVMKIWVGMMCLIRRCEFGMPNGDGLDSSGVIHTCHA